MNGLSITGVKLSSPAPTKKQVVQSKIMNKTNTPLKKPSVPRSNKTTVKKEEPKKKVTQ